MGALVERTVAVSYGTFSWEEEVPVFATDDGIPTLTDTGTRFKTRTGDATGRVVKTANRGESILVPTDVAASGDALGAFASSQAEPSTDAPSDPEAAAIAVAEPKPKRGPGRPRGQRN